MARTYEAATAWRRERLSPEARELGELFAQAYGIAMRVIELREKHG
jgi:hypothetical protein